MYVKRCFSLAVSRTFSVFYHFQYDVSGHRISAFIPHGVHCAFWVFRLIFLIKYQKFSSIIFLLSLWYFPDMYVGALMASFLWGFVAFFFHSVFPLFFRLHNLCQSIFRFTDSFFCQQNRIYCWASLVKFLFQLSYFSLQNFHLVHFYTFYLFIDILYLMGHCHNTFFYFLKYGFL